MPANGDPDFEDVPVQKYVASRAAWPVTPPWSTGFYLAYHPPIQLRFPHISPFSGTWRAWKVTCVECPAGSGQYYRTFMGDIQHEGFPNEYVLVIGVQCTDDLKAVPPPGAAELTGVGPDACGVVPPQSDPPSTLPPGPWPPAPNPTFHAFLDTFTDTGGVNLDTHISDTGETWTMGTGEIDIDSGFPGAVAIDVGGGESWYVADYTASIPGTVKLTFYTPSDLSFGIIAGVLFRATDANNWEAVSIVYDGANHHLGHFECVAGSVTELDAGTSLGALTPSQAYSITVELVGTAITATLREVGTTIQVENYTSAVDPTLTKIGINGIDSSVPIHSVLFTRLETTI